MRRGLQLVLVITLGCVSAERLDRLAKQAAVGARQVGCSDAVGALLDGGASPVDGGAHRAD